MSYLGVIGRRFPSGFRIARIDWPPPGGARAFARGNQTARLLPVTFTVLKGSRTYTSVQTPPWWGQRSITSTPVPDFKIEGQVLQRDESGVDTPLYLCRVRLYYRVSGAMIATTITAADGSFRFVDLMPGAGAYYVVAFDPEGAPVQNALIYDRLASTPI